MFLQYSCSWSTLKTWKEYRDEVSHKYGSVVLLSRSYIKRIVWKKFYDL